MKIFHNEALIAEYNGNGSRRTWFQRTKITTKRWGRNTFVFSVIVGIGYAFGAVTNPITTFATVEKIVTVEMESPVMQRIAKCESGNTHFDPKTKQVLVRTNTNKSYDQGKFQINSIWNSKATELGYNLMVEKDNEAFAMYLYKTHGTEPWVYSKSCWNK